MMTWGSTSIRLVGWMLILPLILRRLSPSEITLWYLFGSITAFQMLAELGFGQTFSRVIAYAVGGATDIRIVRSLEKTSEPQNVNWELLYRIYGTSLYVYKILFWFGLVAVGAVGTWSLIEPIAKSNNPIEGWLAWGICLIVSSFVFRGNAYSAVLLGLNRVAVVRRWEALFGICTIITNVVVVLAGGGLIFLVLSTQIWSFFSLLRNKWLVKVSLHSRCKQSLSTSLDKEILYSIWPATWKTGVAMLASQGLIHLGCVMAAQEKDSAKAASFLLGVRLIQTVTIFCVAPFYSKLPLLARMLAEGRHIEIIRISTVSMRLGFWSFAFLAVSAAFAGPWVFQQLGSRTPFPEISVWATLCGAFFVERYGAFHLQLFSLTNVILAHVANGVSAVITVVMALALFPTFGLTALPLGMLTGYSLFYGWYCARLSRRLFRLNFPHFEMQTAALPALFIIVGLLFANYYHY